jgi:hypothetical protein
MSAFQKKHRNGSTGFPTFKNADEQAEIGMRLEPVRKIDDPNTS